MVGFGFRDPALARLIFSWGHQDRARRLVIVDNAEKAMRLEFNELRDAGVLHIINKNFEDTDWQEISTILDSS